MSASRISTEKECSHNNINIFKEIAMKKCRNDPSSQACFRARKQVKNIEYRCNKEIDEDYERLTRRLRR